MANPLLGEVELVAGERTYTLSYSINALCEAEDATGMTTDGILTAMSRGLPIKVLRGVIWAGLQHHHECTLFEAGDIIGLATAPAAREALANGLAAAFPTPTKEKGKNPPKAAAGAT